MAPSAVTRADGTIDSLLVASAERHGRRRALVSGDTELSYGELEEAADGLADRVAGVASPGGGGTETLRGERIAVIVPNLPGLVVALFACWRLGAVAVPLSARLRERELSEILVDCAPRVVVSVRSHLGYSFTDVVARLAARLPSLTTHLVVDAGGQVEDAIPGAIEPKPAAPLDASVASLLYTSGTTGTPKGAVCRHVREVDGAPSLAAILGLTPDDVSVFVIPVSHAFGLSCLLATLASAGTAVLVESTFSPKPILTAIERHGATVLHGSPTLFTSIEKARPDGLPSTVRTGFVAGALPPPQLLTSLERSGARILNLYGMTEAGAIACCRLDDPFDLRAAAAARPLPGVELRVVASDEHPDGGEVEVRGPSVTPGYYRRPEETSKAFDGDWLRTGDLGTLSGGRLRIHGRLKDIVHVSGFNVFPAEIEAALLAHPDVAQACVVGVPDETTGEALRAFVVLRRGSNVKRANLLRFLRERIAGYKLPYALTIVPKLPLLASGKADRLRLRRLSEAERSGRSGRRPEIAAE